MYFEYIYLLITGLYQLFLCVQLIGFRVNKDIIYYECIFDFSHFFKRECESESISFDDPFYHRYVFSLVFFSFGVKIQTLSFNKKI